mgnify:CR=1 FL=1
MKIKINSNSNKPKKKMLVLNYSTNYRQFQTNINIIIIITATALVLYHHPSEHTHTHEHKSQVATSIFQFWLLSVEPSIFKFQFHFMHKTWHGISPQYIHDCRTYWTWTEKNFFFGFTTLQSIFFLLLVYINGGWLVNL